MPAETVLLRDEAGRQHRVTISDHGDVTVDNATFTMGARTDGSTQIDGPSHGIAWIATIGDKTWVFIEGHVYTFEVEEPERKRRPSTAQHGSLMAPMPATVRRLSVGTGDAVRRGDVLIVLEAMKMELPVRATSDGLVTAINCREGDVVQPGVSLIEIDG